MRTALVVSADETLRTRLRRSLDGRAVFAVGSDEEALRTLRFTAVDLIVKEATPIREVPVFIERARQICPTAVVVCVLTADPPPEDDPAVEAADFVLLHPFSASHFQSVLRQAEEKLRLLQEVSALRSTSRRLPEAPAGFVTPDPGPALDLPSDVLTRMVKEFAKALSAGFDISRVLDLFLDAVAELARPSRSAILVADQVGRLYRITAFRGLAPHVVESVALSADAGLPLWLAGEGRLIHIEEAQARASDPTAREIAREMAVLQATIAMPLMSHGELVAVLTLGQRVTGGAYSRRETEIIYNLASHLATAIRDIRVHHLLEYQKQFTERILAHMSNGVITIGPDERVVIMNRRAEEILGMAARDALNRDLRVLPSPLGDLLFETLTRGRAIHREEVQLALRSLPLEVSTYPVMGEGTTTLGAVLVFEDLTAQRQVARERREAEQLELLTRVVARIADEIKNPLVSIRTFMELLEERYDDAGFRSHFASVVGRDVRRLVQMFEKLAALVNEGDYKLEVVDVRLAVEECLLELGAQAVPAAGAEARLLTFIDESTQKHVSATYSYEGRTFLVRGDRAMLKKAIAYLVWYLLRKTSGQDAKLSVSVSRLDKEDRVRIIVASRTAEVRADELHRIFDPIQVVQENLIDVGPCVSQRIIEAQGGRLEAKQGRAEVAFTAVLPGVPGEHGMTDRARILVVDDEMGPRESLRMILKPRHDIATADSGEAALRTLKSFHPDLIFMDIKMPQMDGIELLRRIKGIDPSIEVVMITAYASLETVKNALTHGAFEYLIKPFSRQDLEETVRRALARRQTEMGTRSQLTSLVDEMRALSGKTRDLEEEARREQAEQSLRVTQLSILREISRGLLGQLDLTQLVATITEQLRSALGYDEVRIHLGSAPSETPAGPAAVVCPIRDDGATLGYLAAANQAGKRPIDPRERELLEMLSDYLAVAIRNSRLYGQVADTKRSLEQLIQSAGDGIISLDHNDKIVGWNPAAERIFSLATGDAIGRPITELLPRDQYQSARNALAPNAPVRVFEIASRREDGNGLNLAVTLSALTGREGQLEGVLAIVHDNTAQRELEAQMLQSEKLTAMGQMAGGIAHDFNNLLQAILGYAQLMGKNPANVDVVRRGLDVIEAAATGGAETVRRIQKFARLRPDEPFVSLDLNSVVNDSVAITQPRWEERAAKGGLPLRMELSLPAVPAVMGRPSELNEVVTNLILNAIDAMPSGGVLSIRTSVERGDSVVLTLADTGTGMPEAVRKRVFDPFFTTKGELGTGLGLSVSYSIVKRHNGEMRVDSQVGRGTTFTIVLPVAASPSLDAPADTDTLGNRRGRILLVDNDAQVLAILTEMLREGNHEVVPVASGPAALDAFRPGAFDVILTNLGMVGMTGWEVAQRIRALDRNVPVIFITGWGLHEEDQERCRHLGIHHVLFKPVGPGELHRTIQSTLAEHPARA